MAEGTEAKAPKAAPKTTTEVKLYFDKPAITVFAATEKGKKSLELIPGMQTVEAAKVKEFSANKEFAYLVKKGVILTGDEAVAKKSEETTKRGL